MVMVAGQFDAVAQAITERITDRLSARVWVVNERGVVIASGTPGAVGRPFELLADGPAEPCLRVPLRLDGWIGEVVVAQPADGEVLSQRVVQVVVDLIIDQAAVVTRLPNHEELKSRFIHDLLCGTAGDEAAVLREGQILGMDLTRQRAVILIDGADYILGPAEARPELDEAQVWRRARLVISSIVSFFHLPNDTICAYIGNGEVVVLKASSTHDLVDWTGHEDLAGQSNPSWANLSALKRACRGLLPRLCHDTGASMSIGIGRYHPGIPGLVRSYQDARAALALGRHVHGQNGVHCLDELGVAAFIAPGDERTRADLARHLLSPLDHEPDLLATLDTFFRENCCPSLTAGQLAIHRNTLSYRLDKVALLTGLDPRHFDDAVQIRLSLLLRTLQGRLA